MIPTITEPSRAASDRLLLAAARLDAAAEFLTSDTFVNQMREIQIAAAVQASAEWLPIKYARLVAGCGETRLRQLAAAEIIVARKNGDIPLFSRSSIERAIAEEKL